MKTDDLTNLLATGSGAVDARSPTYRSAAAVALGMLVSALLMTVLLGVRHDLASAVARPMYWLKLGYVVFLSVASLYVVSRLARPGSRLFGATIVLAVPVLAIWGLAGFEFAAADQRGRGELFWGKTWASCPLLIAMLSVPTFVAVFWALKGFAPTRLRLAGGAAGLAAGALGAVVYSIHCPEMGAPFLGSWYLLGVLLPAAVGAVVGPRLLRW